MLKAGIVESYNAERRTCLVRIPGVTDNTDDLPEAEFCNPLGDKSEHTEIRILKGDRVWLMFEDGNLMRPVIMGYRPKLRDNELEWRKWHHEKVRISADQSTPVTGSGLVTDPTGVIKLSSNFQIVLESTSGYKGISGDPAGDIGISSNYRVTINCKELVVNASDFVMMSTPELHVTGRVTAGKDVLAVTELRGNGGISLKGHQHPGVIPGPSVTGVPI